MHGSGGHLPPLLRLGVDETDTLWEKVPYKNVLWGGLPSWLMFGTFGALGVLNEVIGELGSFWVLSTGWASF